MNNKKLKDEDNEEKIQKNPTVSLFVKIFQWVILAITALIVIGSILTLLIVGASLVIDRISSKK